MNSRKSQITMILSLVCITLIYLVSGCAAKKTLTESPETGLTLIYKLPAESGVYYTSRSDIKQGMEIQGQSIGADIEQVLAFDMKPVSVSEGTLTLDITLDTIGMSVTSPMVSFSADVSSILGKSFTMDLSDKGEELDLTQAESLKYSMAQSGERSIAMNFQTFFPDLPENKIKAGDSWIDTDTINESSETEEVVMYLHSNNTFEGVETVAGYECVKIVSLLSGPRNVNQETQGVTLVTEGEVKGTLTWYFAFKEGIFVKSVMISSSQSTVTASGAQNISFPMSMEIKSVIEISEK